MLLAQNILLESLVLSIWEVGGKAFIGVIRVLEAFSTDSLVYILRTVSKNDR